MKHIIFIVITLLFSTVVFAQSIEDITWDTEEYPPYNYSENGVATGIAVELLVAMWKKAGVAKTPKDINVLPWARGVNNLENNPGSCLFSTTITPKRQHELGYKFVFPIPQVSEDSGNHIIARKSKNIKINAINDLKAHKIGVVSKDVGQSLIEAAKVSASNIDKCNNGNTLVKKLKKGRYDIISYGFSTAVNKMKEEGVDPSEFEIVYTFPPLPMGYAFHKDTDPNLLKMFQAILDGLHKDGTAETILKKYLNKE